MEMLEEVLTIMVAMVALVGLGWVFRRALGWGGCCGCGLDGSICGLSKPAQQSPGRQEGAGKR